MKRVGFHGSKGLVSTSGDIARLGDSCLKNMIIEFVVSTITQRKFK